MQPITDIQDIKIYYPFLMDKRTPMRLHQRDIISYLLLTDKVILPPDHIFNKNVVRSNTDFLKANDLFSQLFINGQIITTSTDHDIRDIQDIIEQRSKITDIHIPNFSIPLYYRDGKKQKDLYIDFFLKEFGETQKYFYEKDKVKEFVHFIKTKPGHQNILDKLYSLKFIKTESEILNYTKYLTKIAYLKGGADGNNAIMPTLDSNNDYTFFNDYYSLRFVQQFSDRVSKKLKCDITELKFDKFIKVSQSLKSFKEDYFAKSTFFKDLDNEIYKVLQQINKSDNYRKYKTGINYLIGLVVGELIEDYVLPLVGLNVQNEFALKIGVAVLFDKLKIFERVLSIANKTIDMYSLPTYLTVQFGEVIDKFDDGIALVK
jgi:hypothetical protein